MVGKKHTLGPVWESLRQDIDLEDPTPLLIRVYLGCTQREAEVDHAAVQAETNLSRRLTTDKVTNEMRITRKNISQ